MTDITKTELLALTTEIVVAHISNNSVSVDQVKSLIKEVHRALEGLGSGGGQLKLNPAVPIQKSVGKDAITCLECGRSAKMLKRHLSTAHGLDVKEYRQRWKLPSDYPMVAPNYAAKRSALAKKIGLGTRTRKRGRKNG